MSRDIEEFDDIIIGSGIGGLTCAAYLSKSGRRVAVFEKEMKPGGCCTSYEKDGFSFAPSIHWLSFCKENQVIGSVIKDLQISDKVSFSTFNPLVRFIDEKRDITLSFDIDKLIKELKNLYPEESTSIDDFFILCGKFIKELNQMLEDSISMTTKLDRLKFGIGYSTGKYPIIAKVKKYSAYDFLRSYFKDEGLIDLFYIMGPGDKDAEIFPILSRIGWAIDKNYYYIKEGNNICLSNAFAHGVIKNGGKIYYNSLVKKVIIENKVAVGIELKDGTIYKGKNIISNADGMATYYKLIGKENLSKKFIRKIEEKQQYSSSFVVNLGVDLDFKKLGYKGESITFMPSTKLEDISGSDPTKCKIVMQFRSLRDSSLAPKGMNTLMITARMPYDYKNIWGTGGNGIRGEEYEKIKNEVADALIKTAEKIIPNLSDHIIVKDISTPLTFERYTGNYKGAIMGWQEKTITLPKIEIKNLYQVGHWTFPGGSINRVVACGKNLSKVILRKEGR